MIGQATVPASRHFNTDQLAAFDRDGYVLRRGLFGGATLDRLLLAVADLAAMPETPGKAMFYYENSVTDPNRRVLSRVEYFADFHPWLGRFLREGELIERAGELLGMPAVLFKEKVNFKLPGGQGFEPHQDMQAGWDVYGPIHLTAMITIDPATERNGCLEIAAGQHKRGLIGEMWKPLTEAQLAGVEFVKFPTTPGDVVFFDSFAPHRSAPNLTANSRRILYITYGRSQDGDHRERYFADKRRNFPPDIEREPGKEYRYKV